MTIKEILKAWIVGVLLIITFPFWILGMVVMKNDDQKEGK